MTLTNNHRCAGRDSWELIRPSRRNILQIQRTSPDYPELVLDLNAVGKSYNGYFYKEHPEMIRRKVKSQHIGFKFPSLVYSHILQ